MLILEKLFSRKLLPLTLLIFFTLIAILITYIFRASIIPPIILLSDYIKNLGNYGHVLMTVLIILSCYPPLIGYGTLLSLSGFIFGFPDGMISVFFINKGLHWWLDRWCLCLSDFSLFTIRFL